MTCWLMPFRAPLVKPYVIGDNGDRLSEHGRAEKLRQYPPAFVTFIKVPFDLNASLWR